MRRLVVFLAVLFAATTANGQNERDLKSLSAEEVRQYMAGAGMGYAKPAELNHFPGPMHVLELAEQLKLTPDQRAATQKLMDAHKAQARALGGELVSAERELDELFRAGGVDEAVLARAVRTSAAIVGEYRLSHLETHRRMRSLLTDEQVRRYDELRGYASGKAQHRKH